MALPGFEELVFRIQQLGQWVLSFCVDILQQNGLSFGYVSTFRLLLDSAVCLAYVGDHNIFIWGVCLGCLDWVDSLCSQNSWKLGTVTPRVHVHTLSSEQ